MRDKRKGKKNFEKKRTNGKGKKILRSRSVKSRNLCVQYLVERGKEERDRTREGEKEERLRLRKYQRSS